MRCERKGQTESGSQLCTEGARSEQPYRDPRSRTWHRPHCLVGLHRSQQSLQLHDIMGKILRGRREIPAQGACRALIRAGGAAETEIDTPP